LGGFGVGGCDESQPYSRDPLGFAVVRWGALGWVRWVVGCDESQPYSRDSLGFSALAGWWCGGVRVRLGALGWVRWGIAVNLSFETSLLSARWTPVELVLAGRQRQTSRGFGPCQPFGLRVWWGSGELERHHALSIELEAVTSAVNWSVRYLPGPALPEKAISVLDLAA